MERYYDLGSDTIEKINELSSKFVSSPVKIDVMYVGDNKLKKLIKVAKVRDDLQHITKKQILITINESLWDSISHEDEVIEILVREELNAIQVNNETGKIKMGKPTFNSSNSIIDKYSFEAVRRAKELETLTLSQTEDKETEKIDISI